MVRVGLYFCVLGLCALGVTVMSACNPAPAPPGGMTTEGSGDYKESDMARTDEAPPESGSAPKDDAQAAMAEESGEHDHDHDHDHGDDHVHTPMFGGTLVELGDHEANLEIAFDGETGTLTLYTLDAHAENPVRLEAESVDVVVEVEDAEPMTLSLAAIADPLTGETVGDTAKFEATDEALVGLDHFDVTVPAITLRGATYTDVHYHHHD